METNEYVSTISVHDGLGDKKQQGEEELKQISPNVGFALRANAENGKTIILNFLSHEDVGPPEYLPLDKNIKDEKVAVRVPISLEPAVEHSLDGDETPSICFDCVLNPHTFSGFEEFAFETIAQILEKRYKLVISRDYTRLPEKYYGPTTKPPPQTIRVPKKPAIIEMTQKEKKKEPEIARIPNYTIHKQKTMNGPWIQCNMDEIDAMDVFRVRIELPTMTSVRDFDVGISSNTITLDSSSYSLELIAKENIIIIEDNIISANFNRNSKWFEMKVRANEKIKGIDGVDISNKITNKKIFERV